MQDSELRLHWNVGLEAPRLESGQVHLWAAALHEFSDQASEMMALLSHSERTRAHAFKFPGDRTRFIIRRGLLRRVLGGYLGQSPAEIRFSFGKYGKPETGEAVGGRHLFFNLSSSAGIAVYAATRAYPIGIDIEYGRDIPDMEGIARRFFQPREIQELMTRSPAARRRAFYEYWTRKATGEGITERLAHLEVTLATEPSVVSLPYGQGSPAEWRLQPFSPAEGYFGCIAYRGVALDLVPRRIERIRESCPG